MSRWVNIDDISLLKTVSVGGLSAKALWKRIRQQPSIDLVRCGECVRANHELSGVYCGMSDALMGANGFCSLGKRKENR